MHHCNHLLVTTPLCWLSWPCIEFYMVQMTNYSALQPSMGSGTAFTGALFAILCNLVFFIGRDKSVLKDRVFNSQIYVTRTISPIGETCKLLSYQHIHCWLLHCCLSLRFCQIAVQFQVSWKISKWNQKTKRLVLVWWGLKVIRTENQNIVCWYQSSMEVLWNEFCNIWYLHYELNR